MAKAATTTKKAEKEPPAPKLPKGLGDCVDLYKETQLRRYEIQKKHEAELEPVRRLERALEERLVGEISKSDSAGTMGKVYQAVVVVKPQPVVEDRAKFEAYVRKNGAFHLMTSAISSAAVKEAWEAGKRIPGIGVYNHVSLSVTKIKGQ